MVLKKNKFDLTLDFGDNDPIHLSGDYEMQEDEEYGQFMLCYVSDELIGVGSFEEEDGSTYLYFSIATDDSSLMTFVK